MPRRDRPVRPEFSVAQSKALRVAISFGMESEDGHLVRALRNALRELNRAEDHARKEVDSR